MSQSVDKGPAILILLLVAFAISGVGVALDGKVISPATDSETLIDNTVAQSVLSRHAVEPMGATEPSDVALQLRRAVDAANRSDTESVDRLEQSAAASKVKIEEINRILGEEGGSSQVVSSSEKAGQFNRQLAELKTRLGELQQSR